MKEIVVASGKGGTGKTSFVGSFAALARGAVVADCDVDAPDLHLLLRPRVRSSADFSGGQAARVLEGVCTGCGACEAACRFEAIAPSDGVVGSSAPRVVDPLACEGCGVCAHVCPESAIELGPVVNGTWFVSDTDYGTLVHARLGIAESNSGKLVTLVRREARAIAEETGSGLIIVDGSPGIGCPVIASLTGADLAVLVTEPTRSGLHDLSRVAELCDRLGVPCAVCVNRWDLNAGIADEIGGWCAARGHELLGLVPYDETVTKAQIAGRSVVEHSRGPAASAIMDVWKRIASRMELLEEEAS